MNFQRFFRPQAEELDDEAEQINRINELLDFAATAYYPKMIQWLEDEANRPLAVGNHSDMIQSAVRANTLREIRDTLVRRIEHARSAAREIVEDRDG
jgi:hypothetical protein